MIILTGVSRGLGAALFDALYDDNREILALGRNFTDRQREVADGLQVRLRVTDLTDLASLPQPAELAEIIGDADTVNLVHNAGTIEPFAPIGAIQPDQLLHAARINFVSPMLLTNALVAAAAGDRVTTGPGKPLVRVIYISSSAAKQPSGGRAVYCATKAGSEMFFETLALQYADDPSVSVSIVDPGIMDTDMQQVVRLHAHAGTYFPDRERFLSRFERGELASPQLVARRIIAEHLSVAAS
jgi:NAD(P)-dependent dehydrogenase (short-subunit alcohol dehydrogenase family)